MEICRPQVERLTQPRGIDHTTPEFTWFLSSGRPGNTQTAYEIEVDAWVEGGFRPVWRTGKVSARLGEEVLYAGEALSSRTSYRWRARAWDVDDQPGFWCEWQGFETGILYPDALEAQWIGGGGVLRREFVVEEMPIRARAYVTGVGYYEFYCNGQKASVGALAPSFTDFTKRVEYEIIDLLPLLNTGANAVGFMLGDGWWRHHNGNKLVAFGEIDLFFADGRQEAIRTDETWSSAAGPVVQDLSATNQQIFDGITFDGRLLERDWCQPGMTPLHSWAPAALEHGPAGRLVPTLLPAVDVVETLQPKSVTRVSDSRLIVDFGQNFAGWIRLQARGPAGTEFSFEYAELLHANGELNKDTLRKVKANDRFYLRGDESGETLEPHFTYHGFRYAQIDGPLDLIDEASLEGCVAHTAFEPTLEFQSSDDVLNWLVEACRWTVKSNHYSVPTDCCQRDERRGWGMDGYLMSNSATYLFDMDATLRKWHADATDNQLPTGNLLSDALPPWPHVSSLGWTRIMVLIPWRLYRMYGDRQILERAYPYMEAYCEYVKAAVGDNVLQPDFSAHPAEWLCIGQKEKVLPDNALACELFQVMAEIADLQGETEDALTYREAAASLAARFHQLWFEKHNGCYQGGTFFAQCNQVYPLHAGITPPEDVDAVFGRLVDDLASARGEEPFLTTGIGSSVHLLEVLSKGGREDLAWGIIQRPTYPGWRFMRENGATSIWERWEKMTYHQMNAHNHAGLSGVAGWVMKYVAGLEVLPGVEPCFNLRPALRLPIARLSVNWLTRWGPLSLSWEKTSPTNECAYLRIEVPPGTTARLSLPGFPETISLASGGHAREVSISAT